MEKKEQPQPTITGKQLSQALISAIRELENVELATKPFKEAKPTLDKYFNILQVLANIAQALNVDGLDIKAEMK